MHGTLGAAVASVLDAVNSGNRDALPDSAGRLVRHATGTDASLVVAGIHHVTDAAAAVQVGWKRDEQLRDALWLLFRKNEQWSCVGPSPDEPVAKWFLAHPEDGLVQFDALPETPEVRAVADSLLAHVTEGTTPSSEAEAALVAPVDDDGLVPTVGAVRVLPAANRAMIELAWVEADDPEWTDESRWAVLHQEPEGWRVDRMVYIGSMRSLLEDAGLAWPSPPE